MSAKAGLKRYAYMYKCILLFIISYPQISLHPFLFIKIFSFLGANRTKSTSVDPRLLRALYKYLNTIQYNNSPFTKIHKDTSSMLLNSNSYSKQ